MDTTRLVMNSSGIALGLAGAACLFAPDETSSALRLSAPALLVQILGAAYLGMGMANWAARGSMIGGIYARPISLLNSVHFTVAAVSIAKIAFATREPSLIAISAIYGGFAVVFNLLLLGKIGGRAR
ncbi:MAG: hypothetical protein AAF417_06880 [Pseudomonadota bacterium]